MSRSMFFLTVLLVSFWAAVNGAEVPSKTYKDLIEPVKSSDWNIAARYIALDAQRASDGNQKVPAYEWLFKPWGPTVRAKIDQLKRANSLLDALRQHQEDVGTVPDDLTEYLKEHLQGELDRQLGQCVYWAVFYKVGDVPETVAHCHREFTVYYGAELQHKMKGVISERQVGDIKKQAQMNYYECRKENPVEYCETQSTISVNGEEFKPLTGFAFEKLSPGEFAQGIRRNFVRAFSNEGQPGEKRRAFFQGGARPRPFVLRPH